MVFIAFLSFLMLPGFCAFFRATTFNNFGYDYRDFLPDMRETRNQKEIIGSGQQRKGDNISILQALSQECQNTISA